MITPRHRSRLHGLCTLHAQARPMYTPHRQPPSRLQRVPSHSSRIPYRSHNPNQLRKTAHFSNTGGAASSDDHVTADG
ncbi:hypothetical protein P170DRAFT_433073 [Aspergillus steynii IBT 23096]|uniref:Uncharacterized protein n=1 Tax=Aspergillus steynii IBT 23096 TaxID=1392250 RepID=A0A2I2GRQ6_9EURO|nr:uncharacterized protein P170DRAFT_433073 [Aspergillus steynii IBT 23096]PLB55557.1 hypothetical protein P170DRAFT_433073 [Aspergillus steynii IBT 23096]